MKTIRGFKIWQIVYPIGIYYVASSLMYFVLELFMGDVASTYMLRQMVCSAVTIPFVLKFYQLDKNAEDIVYGKQSSKIDGAWIKNALFAMVSAVTFGIAVNNVIAMTPLIQLSDGFKEANSSFFAGGMIYEILGSCLIIPIAEELLFRGVVYKRLKLMIGVWPAVVCSALIFGILHVNLVQFLYAAILGLLLAFLLEKTKKLSMAILGHIAANLAAVIRSETGWLDFSYQATPAGIGFTLLMAAIAAAVIGFMYREYTKDEQ